MNDKKIRRMGWNVHDGDCYHSYEEIIDNLEKQIKQSGENFDFICGIPRGGLTPAVHLSHSLKIKFMDFKEFIRRFENFIEKYDQYTENFESGKFAFKKHKVLLIDDICHSGNTINGLLFEEDLKVIFDLTRTRFAVLVKNEIYTGDHVWKHGIEATKDDWIQFPWESKIEQEKAEKMIQNHIELAG